MEKFTVCLVQPPDYKHSSALLEVCQLVAGSLESLGKSCRFQMNQVDPGTVNIVLGYHLLAAKAREHLASHRVILYQLEQLSDREGWFTEEREALLRSAWAVWDYSRENAEFLRRRGFEKTLFLPLGYHPRLERIRHRKEADKDIDVLFYGAVNDRRRGVVHELRKRLRTEWLFGIYGKERDAYIARARIVLNVHFYEARILEQVRLAYLLNNRCFVVSEAAEHNPFGEGIVLGPIGELPELCERFVARPEERWERADRGYRAFQQQPMVEHLRAVLGEMSLL